MYPLRANNVLEIYQQRELINLKPPYQRLSVWNEKQQQLFIDSVINRVDIPKLYFHELLPSQRTGSKFKYGVIDGKQRLLALWKFIDNDLPLASDFVFFEDEKVKAGGATYSQLLEKFPVLRARFDGFDVPVMLVQAEDEEFIEDLFARLNIAVPLSAPEYRNALGGPLPLLIRTIAWSTSFFTERVDIRNNRYQHLDLAARFLYLTRSPGFNSTKKATLHNWVVQYRRAREKGGTIATRSALAELENETRQLLDDMSGFFTSKDRLLRGQGRIKLYFHVFRIHRQLGAAVPISREHLERFDADVTAARLKSQRMAAGSGEVLSAGEQVLVNFDREKQSSDDGGALERQYGYLREYFQKRFGIGLPGPS
jgi:hypothetical protein